MIFHHPIGFIPDVLDQVYPAGLVHTSGELPLWKKTLDRSVVIEKGPFDEDPNVRRVRAVSEYQFGREIATILLEGELKIVVSNKTERIRTVHADGDHVPAAPAAAAAADRRAARKTPRRRARTGC